MSSNSRSSTQDETRQQIQDLREQISILTGRLENTEMKLAVIGRKQDTEPSPAQEPSRGSVPESQTAKREPEREIRSTKETTTNLPQSVFSEDEAVKGYKQGLELFRNKKFPEAMLAFAGFLDRFADHPWAGSAQFYSGQSYFLQKEYRLALQEYERVITSYDRSPHITETLEQMALCHEALKTKEYSKKHRQLLSKLFRNSPAARSQAVTAPPTAPAEGT